jgi:hypothetical protein
MYFTLFYCLCNSVDSHILKRFWGHINYLVHACSVFLPLMWSLILYNFKRILLDTVHLFPLVCLLLHKYLPGLMYLDNLAASPFIPVCSNNICSPVLPTFWTHSGITECLFLPVYGQLRDSKFLCLAFLFYLCINRYPVVLCWIDLYLAYTTTFSLLSIFWQNKRRLMGLPCRLCIPYNF